MTAINTRYMGPNHRDMIRSAGIMTRIYIETVNRVWLWTSLEGSPARLPRMISIHRRTPRIVGRTRCHGTFFSERGVEKSIAFFMRRRCHTAAPPGRTSFYGCAGMQRRRYPWKRTEEQETIEDKNNADGRGQFRAARRSLWRKAHGGPY